MNENQSTLDVLDELSNTPSKNEKQQILQREKDNTTLRDAFYYALNPYIKYNIKKIPEYHTNNGDTKLFTVMASLYCLYERHYTGNRAQEWLSFAFESLSEEDAQVLERIIGRDLKCGVGIKTVNKVWKNLIPEFNNMLAEPMREDTLKNISFPAYAQTKMDGQRVNLIVDNVRNMTVRTRNGKELEGFETHLQIPNHFSNVVFDGEMLVMDDNNKPMERKKSNGIMNKVQKGTATEYEMKRIVVFLWDMISLQDFQYGKSNVPYDERLHNLQYYINYINNGYIREVNTKMVDSMDDANDLFEKALERGEEGLVLKNMNHEWKNGRSKDWVKMKAEKTADLEIIGIEEGKGRLEGKLGSFIVSTSDGLVQCSVGSGFSDQQRIDYFTNDMIGKITENNYNEVISREDEEVKSLYLPIFGNIREDKDEANSIDELA